MAYGFAFGVPASLYRALIKQWVESPPHIKTKSWTFLPVAHLYSPYRSSCTRDACQTIPQHYPQRTTMPTHLSVNASSGFWRTWAFLKGQVLGVTKKMRTSTIHLQEQTYKQTVKRWHWKYTKYTLLYTVYFLPHTFVLGAFLYCTIYSLALSCVFFFKMNPRHRGIGGAATWEPVLWHSGSSRARCNSKRSSCKGGRSQDGRLTRNIFFQGWFAMLKAFWLVIGMTQGLGLFCHLLSEKEFPYEWYTLTRVGICWSLQYLYIYKQ